jgi:hypothetical protein
MKYRLDTTETNDTVSMRQGVGNCFFGDRNHFATAIRFWN